MRPRIGLVFSLALTIAAFAAQIPSPSPAATGDRPAVEVRHTPRRPGGEWAVAETANFRIFHNETREVAEKAARLVEASRAAACEKWFGEPAPTWEPRCDVYLYATRRGLQPGDAPAAADGRPPDHRRRRRSRSLAAASTSTATEPNLFVGILRHETTHVVLAGAASASTGCRIGWTRAWPCCRSRAAASTCI